MDGILRCCVYFEMWLFQVEGILKSKGLGEWQESLMLEYEMFHALEHFERQVFGGKQIIYLYIEDDHIGEAGKWSKRISCSGMGQQSRKHKRASSLFCRGLGGADEYSEFHHCDE